MRNTTLGKTGLEVSRVAFGTWQIGGDYGSFDEERALGAIRHAREKGVTLFDTAFGYGKGAAETLLGKALRDELDHRRDEIVIATKGGITPWDEDRQRDAGRAAIQEQVEASLRNLGVDHIDLYQIHWPDPATPQSETAETLQELVDAGKIRHAGVSNYDVSQLEDFEKTRPVETLQPPYHLFRRGIEDDILPWCHEHNVGVLAYSPLGSGLLTGGMSPDTTFDDDDWRSQSEGFNGEKFHRNLGIVDELAELARSMGISVGQLAIAWTLANPAVHVAIAGARSADHIDDSLAAADVDLDADTLARIDQIVAPGHQITEAAAPEGVT